METANLYKEVLFSKVEESTLNNNADLLIDISQLVGKYTENHKFLEIDTNNFNEIQESYSTNSATMEYLILAKNDYVFYLHNQDVFVLKNSIDEIKIVATDAFKKFVVVQSKVEFYLPYLKYIISREYSLIEHILTYSPPSFKKDCFNELFSCNDVLIRTLHIIPIIGTFLGLISEKIKLTLANGRDFLLNIDSQKIFMLGFVAAEQSSGKGAQVEVVNQVNQKEVEQLKKVFHGISGIILGINSNITMLDRKGLLKENKYGVYLKQCIKDLEDFSDNARKELQNKEKLQFEKINSSTLSKQVKDFTEKRNISIEIQNSLDFDNTILFEKSLLFESIDIGIDNVREHGMVDSLMTKIKIVLYQDEDFLFIKLLNNGKPINQEQYQSDRQSIGRGWGLSSIKSNIEKLKGTVNLESLKSEISSEYVSELVIKLPLIK